MKCVLLAILIGLASYGQAEIQVAEEDLYIAELIEQWGYQMEPHEVRTSDGYYLKLHRIPCGRPNGASPCGSGERKRPVMFLQHGLLCSSTDWVVNYPNNSLGFMFADAGYDVWMGNLRGNTYSKKHMFYPVNGSDFWDFSFDDMTKYDLPAMIDYVLETTKQEQVYYVGHSQGTTIVFASGTENEPILSKIKLFFALSPVTRIANLHSPLKYLTKLIKHVEIVFEELQIWEFMERSKYLNFFNRKICKVVPEFCMLLMSLCFGYEKGNIDFERLPIYLRTTPAGTSTKNIYHFSQLINSKRFQKYDYGWIGNLVWYRSMYPPIYHVHAMTVPVVLISGTGDWLSTPQDVEWTSKHLPNVIERISIEGYNHLDFLWGVHSGRDIGEKILDIAERYTLTFQ